ncbi:hypothetical protein KTE19_05750 [Lentilactobacillus sp. IMAU92037]|uniref:hypothetical protein n=1 Tax=Lentilactobacillus TaxID=2767893 RepID=UPI001C27F12D|nr:MULTISPECIES: hypothetical protein [Lentilactobacillus]MBU9789138.1 hypothetical protein [Lentilactobacillus dabitei]MBV0930220.1 hypothetical protein [Lentilactobacillus dabitei]MDM7517064.1 hypothetical protein [Lentilactobacillus sp. TOM.63]
MNIRVVGDIRRGKIQPSLTGNPIVDDALLQNFCERLRNNINSAKASIKVISDHFFDPTELTDDVILMDKQIIRDFPGDLLIPFTIIGVDHSDLVRGNVRNAINALKHFANGDPISNNPTFSK